MTPITLHRKPGMPPAGSEGLFLGWDEDGTVWLFWWSSDAGAWRAFARAPLTVFPAGVVMERASIAPLADVVAHAQLPEPARGDE